MFKEILSDLNIKDILAQYNKNLNEFKNIYVDSLSSSINPSEKIKTIAKNIMPDNTFSLVEIIVSDNDAQVNAKMFKENSDHRRYFTIKEIIQFTEDVSSLDFFIREEVELPIIGKVDVGFFFFRVK